jgi:hypothetical protein
MGAKKTAGPTAEVKPIYSLNILEWQKNPALQTKLRALIEDPTFQLAEQTLMRAAMPGYEPPVKAEANVSAEATRDMLGMRYVHRSGFSYAFRMLRFLIAQRGTEKPQTPYGALLPEDE